MELFAAFFNVCFGNILLLIWIAPPLLLMAAYLIYIVMKTIEEFRNE
ncbi:MAG: hypothetical protein V8R55_01770 [Dysosmobacter sp.]